MLPNTSPDRYLGAFISSFHPIKSDYKNVVQKVAQRIQNQESCLLLKAGRTTLIQSDLEALTSYICFSSLLPQDIANSIDIQHRKFFWRQHKQNNSTPHIA